jgi:hypothetical protein
MMNLNMKNLFGQANNGIGKLKGFLFGSSQSEETSSSSSQDEPNNKSNSNLIQQKNIDSKSPNLYLVLQFLFLLKNSKTLLSIYS